MSSFIDWSIIVIVSPLPLILLSQVGAVFPCLSIVLKLHSIAIKIVHRRNLGQICIDRNLGILITNKEVNPTRKGISGLEWIRNVQMPQFVFHKTDQKGASATSIWIMKRRTPLTLFLNHLAFRPQFIFNIFFFVILPILKPRLFVS